MDEQLVKQALKDYFEKKRRRKKAQNFWGLVLISTVLLLATLLSAGKVKQPLHAASVTLPQIKTATTPVFAEVRGTGIKLFLPAPKNEIYAIGYHQAYNPQALALDSLEPLLETGNQEVTVSTSLGAPRAFIMANRGRLSLANSSVDVAVKEGTVLKSPVTGTILAVVPYMLYGKYNDVRIDIQPRERSDLKVALTHIDKIKVKVGDKVLAGQTVVAEPRHLAFDSQINKYVGAAVAHIHIQVNPGAER